MIGEYLFCQRLIMGKSQTSRVAARVWLLHELEEADDVLIIKSIAVKFFEKVEGNLRLVLFNGLSNCAEIAAQPDRIDFVSQFLSCDDVPRSS